MTAARIRSVDEFASPPGLTVTVLGCSGTYAARGNACSGYLVRSATTTLWVDAGAGTLANIQDHVELGQIDAVVVSHEHPDHWLELPVLRNAFRYGFEREHVPVYGTAATRDLLAALLHDRVEPTFDWNVIEDRSEVTIGDVAFRFARTDHPVETLAMRIEHNGRVLAYTADTGPAFSLAALDRAAIGFDLAFCDATMSISEAAELGAAAVHMSSEQAGAMAREAGVRRLVATHLWPGCDAGAQRAEASAAYGAPVEIAAVHQTYDV